MYFQGLIGSTEMKAKRKKLSSSDYQKYSKTSHPLMSYLKKEIYVLIRTPSYFINCVLTNILVPLIVIIPFMIQSHNQKGPMPWVGLLSNPGGYNILLAAVVGLAAFQASSNGITATSLSREGKEFYISKLIPLAIKQQLLAKFLSGYLFSLIGTILIVLAAMVLLPINIAMAGAMLAVSAVAIIPILQAGLLIDIFHPKLDWENEQKAVKQNLNVLFSMIFAVLMVGGIIYIQIKFIDSLNLAVLFMLACFGLATVGLYHLLMNNGIEQYNKLEG